VLRRRAAVPPSEWTEIGTVTTDSGVLALLDPGMFGPAADVWAEQLADSGLVNFGQLALDPPDAGVLVCTQADGTWAVHARFCADPDGGLAVCEVRVRLHQGEL